MNFKYLFVFFVLGMFLFTSCSKDGVDVTTVEEEEVETEVVSCNLILEVLEDPSVGSLTALVPSGAAPLIYEWSTGETTQGIYVTTSGDYGITVTDNDGCIESVLTSVTIPSGPCTGFGIVVDTFGLTATIIEIGGTPPYQYLWSTGDVTQSITAPVSGDYEVTVIDAEGCSISETFILDATFLCNFLDVALTVTGSTLTASPSGGTTPYFISWSSGETTGTINVVSGNTYTATIEDAVGCTVTESILIP